MQFLVLWKSHCIKHKPLISEGFDEFLRTKLTEFGYETMIFLGEINRWQSTWFSLVPISNWLNWSICLSCLNIQPGCGMIELVLNKFLTFFFFGNNFLARFNVARVSFQIQTEVQSPFRLKDLFRANRGFAGSSPGFW